MLWSGTGNPVGQAPPADPANDSQWAARPVESCALVWPRRPHRRGEHRSLGDDHADQPSILHASAGPVVWVVTSVCSLGAASCVSGRQPGSVLAGRGALARGAWNERYPPGVKPPACPGGWRQEEVMVGPRGVTRSHFLASATGQSWCDNKAGSCPNPRDSGHISVPPSKLAAHFSDPLMGVPS